MDVAQYFIKNKTSSWLVTLILLIGGTMAYFGLGRLEDPQFTLKQALIITSYPGASPLQVEEEVSYPIENAIQQLPYVDHVTSISTSGTSQIMVEMKGIYRAKELKQIWDELRRKVHDLTPALPPGVQAPVVNDDFGDVYGMLYAITGEGYSDEEIRDYVDFLRRELVLVDGVGKVSVSGRQQEQVVVEISRSRLASLGIPPTQIASLLQTQNVVSNAGALRLGPDRIRIHPTGEFQSVQELEQLIISNPAAKELIYLGDVAKVYKDVQEVPSQILKFDGKNTLTLGVSFSQGVNVVDVGALVTARLKELDYARPVGMDINTIYNQPAEVEASVGGFVLNLVESVAIVIVVLLVFMGLRSGFLIGLILLLTVLGTFIFMQQMQIELQRVSLGALIIALGMLVDNAIVITEGILIGMQRRLSISESASAIVKQTKWPLLGATVIAITAFAPIGLSSDATGEFAGSLFWVLLVSLLLSWVTAITLTPFFASLFFKEQLKAGSEQEQAEPELYQGFIFEGYRAVLTAVLRYRVLSYALMILLLVLSVMGFAKVKQVFFPASNTPIFLVDLWQPAGTDIRQSDAEALDVVKYLKSLDGVEAVTLTSGRGADRFMLTYQPERFYAAYSQLVVRVQDKSLLSGRMADVSSYIDDQHPGLRHKLKRLDVGPSTAAKLEARFSGADPNVLRQLAEQAKAIMAQDSGTRNLRDDWSNRVKVIRPQFNEALARRVGISKQDIDDVLLTHVNGRTVGIYRDGTHLLPIITRAPDSERQSVDALSDLQVYSPKLNRYIPISQVVSSFALEWEDPQIMRRDRKRTVTVMVDHNILSDDTAASLLKRVRPQIEAIPLPTGYSLSWGGELEAQTKAQKALFSSLPMGYLVMFVITVLLFNSMRDALVIWACVPMALIGVTLGLLSVNVPFGFLALLGFLSLSGMLVKNGIVLLDQIKLELSQGLAPYQAVYDSAVSRVRPVSMGAITTILGMLPLVTDDFFASMAVVIMFGLGFGTILTLLFLPLMYCSIYRIPSKT
ncbi:efflux RND transporter permease subunit [Rheinheimera tangshanensis]|uniref:Efflux RND transporter permease subunit n=1 Tax=Rheinheimera tangshanensis TaxID=400153 RepID=A0A5C8LW19_9GAMM|nr:efflux RND transporter permease subunit [Rheinheimera tangshanensis]TXK80544.1 efflux RND transporter permease subunit [Rheinheimera tangshanensis]GGM60514.1 multidrug transporter AcrB [Rheinheimera tangshanensis]